jgi:hypothetical protein
MRFGLAPYRVISTLQEIEADLAAGKLGKLLAEADSDFDADQCKLWALSVVGAASPPRPGFAI